MKKVFLAVLMLSVMVGVCSADVPEVIKKIPNLKAGVGFSLIDNKVNHMETLELLNWKGLALEGGYMGDADASGHKIVSVLSYDLLNLKKLGVEVPVLDLINVRPGVYAGFGDINTQRIMESEFDWGVSASIISLKF